MNTSVQFCRLDYPKGSLRGPVLRGLALVHHADEAPDLSYLEQFSADNENEDERRYAAEDKARLANYGRTWACIGVYWKADVLVPDRFGSGVCQQVHSGGLWGIEDDCGKDYLDEVSGEELDALRGQLEALGVNLDGWEELVAKATVKGAAFCC